MIIRTIGYSASGYIDADYDIVRSYVCGDKMIRGNYVCGVKTGPGGKR